MKYIKMKYTKFKSAPGIGLAIILAGGAAAPVLAGDPTGGQLSTSQIFEKARQNYAALNTYSDQGQIVTTVNGTTTVTPFVIRLARPNFYLVEWQKDNGLSYTTPNTTAQMFWSSGAGDLLETGYGAQNEESRDIALDEASSFSGGASTTIPMTFFNTPSDSGLNEGLDSSTFGERRQPDEKVGTVDCYVFSSESQGRTKTLWIGQQDFLIHRVRTVISPETAQADMAQVTEERPQMAAFLHDFTSTETHTNIVVNQPFKKSDFIPEVAYFALPYEEN
jgi:hypothetical protein